MSPITLNVVSRSGRPIVEGGLTVDSNGTVDDLKKALHARKKKFYPTRQRYTLPLKPGQKKPDVLQPGVALKDYKLSEGSEVQFKDLGPQIGYGTVFICEYLGPMLVFPLFYFFPKLFYPFHSEPIQHDIVQKLSLAYWTFHYVKRILETIFVHRFSHATMPINNLFRNCSYYWGFAAFVSYFVNHPLYTPPPATRSYILFAVAMVCQLANLKCHLIMRDLRKPGDKGYQIPRGFLFEYFTCANYTAETAGWICYGFATQTVAAFLFITCGGLQMMQWALGKHKRLVKTFDGKDGREKYPRRWKMIPILF